uniref:Uncharacterized protein n=1 Tax=Arundo donax TaxID=35708 RepID=A0A0A8XWB5_ARUDO
MFRIQPKYSQRYWDFSQKQHNISQMLLSKTFPSLHSWKFEWFPPPK